MLNCGKTWLKHHLRVQIAASKRKNSNAEMVGILIGRTSSAISLITYNNAERLFNGFIKEIHNPNDAELRLCNRLVLTTEEIYTASYDSGKLRLF